MNVAAHFILGISIYSFAANSSAIDIDTSKYFAFTRGGWGASYLFLSKKTCGLNATEVAAYNKAALDRCAETGGRGCTFTDESEPKWKLGNTVENRYGHDIGFCWREVKARVAGDTFVETIASCQHGIFGNPQSELVCSHPLKEHFISTSNLPPSPSPPLPAEFD
jgi:hypothetical protein